ncbi:putative two-component sensor protein with Hpt (Histidine-containing phosphotransfer) domain [Bradyrhizobium sp. STM 3843]|uniref:Hpt domain-containing protein n=1 Tax=unclassified Bradyrhizobium TaxID=2631580 RepID=UPI000240665F|nr:Hpt domain-containing protein [Bradyrhizobium sp. STM 3843]CCE04472.1 putative two-component sensor protein with Hpt (Histidine-containing phosphotransfer) domain [Bradyrhizobium sp. STM 3843]
MAKQKAPAVEVTAYANHHVITQPNPLKKVLRHADDKDLDDPVARAEAALADLSGEFKSWMVVEAERLSKAYAMILEDGFHQEACDELFRAAHDIKGDAATFGYPSAGAAADSLCRIIEHAPDLDRVPPELFTHHINAVNAIVHDHTKLDSVTVARQLSRKLRKVADEYLIHVNRDRPEHLEALLAPSIVPGDQP